MKFMLSKRSRSCRSWCQFRAGVARVAGVVVSADYATRVRMPMLRNMWRSLMNRPVTNASRMTMTNFLAIFLLVRRMLSNMAVGISMIESKATMMLLMMVWQRRPCLLMLVVHWCNRPLVIIMKVL